MAAIDDSTFGSVNNENYKVGGGGPAFWLNLAMSDAVSHQRIVNGQRENNFAAASERTFTADPVEALGLKHMLTGNVIGEQGMSQGYAAAALQILAKLAQTTNPETGRNLS